MVLGQKSCRIRKNIQNLRMPQSRRHGRPRSSRSQHSDSGGAGCRSSASMAKIIAAASIKVMDALFGFVARNDAECCKRELLERSWRRDWGMCNFQNKMTIFKKMAGRIFYDSRMLGVAPRPSRRFPMRRVHHRQTREIG